MHERAYEWWPPLCKEYLRRAGARASGERGASLTEFAIVVPLFVAMIYGSLYLTDLGIIKLHTQQIARYSAWAFTQRELSSYDEDLRHDAALTAARESVKDELTDVFLESDEHQMASSVFLPPTPTQLRDRPVQLLPSLAGADVVEPLSRYGILLQLLGIGSSVESFVAGPFRRLRLNHRGEITARANVLVLPPVRPDRARRAVALAEAGAPRGADLSQWLPTGRVVQDQDGRPIAVTLVTDPWRIPEGYLVTPRNTAEQGRAFSRVVAVVAEDGIEALPGGRLLSFLGGLGGVTELPGGIDEVFGFHVINPRPHVVSVPYTAGRADRHFRGGTAEPGQIDLFSLTAARQQENRAVYLFETMPLFVDERGKSGYEEALNARGEYFMGCRHEEKRGCWE